MMNRIKTLQELNLLDRFLFSEVMADNEILEDVLEIILGHPVPLKDKAQATYPGQSPGSAALRSSW